jgi:hypothetical protein
MQALIGRATLQRLMKAIPKPEQLLEVGAGEARVELKEWTEEFCLKF